MKKIIGVSLILSCFSLGAKAQATSAANQNVALSLSNAIAITFVATGSAVGSSVSIPFSSVADYTNGVQSGAQQMMVQSNKPFNITMNANAANFTYSGSTTPSPTMGVSNVLSCMVVSNGTGGTVSSYFTGFYPITSTAQTIISSCTSGGNQLFSCMYKGMPNYSFPAGTYTTNVIYTATQP